MNAAVDLTSRSIRNVLPLRISKENSLSVGGRLIPVNGDLMLFLSPASYHHFYKSKAPFDVKVENTSEQTIKLLELLISLINGEEMISIKQKDIANLVEIAKALKNYPLCKYLSEESCRFSGKITLRSSFYSLMDEDLAQSDFTFDIGKLSFSCSKMLASFLSPKAASLSFSDGGTPSMRIPIPQSYEPLEFESAFSSIFDILRGLALIITESQLYFLTYVSSQIENCEILAKCFEILLQKTPASLGNIGFLANFAKNIPASVPYESLVEFIANNFYSLSNETLCALPPSILYSVLSSVGLKASNEDQILTVILKSIDINGMQSLPLLKFPQYQTLSTESVETVLRRHSFEEFTLETFDSLLARFKSETCITIPECNRWFSQKENMNASILNGNRLSLESMRTMNYEESKTRLLKSQQRYDRISKIKVIATYSPLLEVVPSNELVTITRMPGDDSSIDNNNPRYHSGIFNILGGKNAVFNSLISATASSSFNMRFVPENVLDWDGYNIWSPHHIRNQWILFDFNEANVKISAFDIWPSDNGYFPKHWVLEGQQSEGTWLRIYESDNDMRFKTGSIVRISLPMKTEPVRAIKFKSLAPGFVQHENDEDCIDFKAVEFYGDIIALKDSMVGGFLSGIP